jgi:hypothetical protein
MMHRPPEEFPMHRRLALALLAAVLAVACRTPEEKLVDRRRDLRDALDRLYSEYGGSDLAKELSGAEGGTGGRTEDERAPGGAEGDRGRAEGERARVPARGSGGVVGRLVQELDRSHFEDSCLAIGRGERPFVLSDRLDAFLKEAEHSRACRDAARIQSDVSALEREVQARR